MTMIPLSKILSLNNFSTASSGYAFTVQTLNQNSSRQKMISVFRMPLGTISVPVNSKTLKCTNNSSNRLMGGKSERTKVPHVLTVAGSDSGAGAGIQADMKACGALGVYCSTVITAVTAQNTLGVQGVHLVPDDFVYEQLRSVLSDMEVDVVTTRDVSMADPVHQMERQPYEVFPLQDSEPTETQRLDLPFDGQDIQ